MKIARNVSFAFNQFKIRVSEGSTSNVLPGNFVSKKVTKRAKTILFLEKRDNRKKGSKEAFRTTKKKVAAAKIVKTQQQLEQKHAEQSIAKKLRIQR